MESGYRLNCWFRNRGLSSPRDSREVLSVSRETVGGVSSPRHLYSEPPAALSLFSRNRSRSLHKVSHISKPSCPPTLGFNSLSLHSFIIYITGLLLSAGPRPPFHPVTTRCRGRGPSPTPHAHLSPSHAWPRLVYFVSSAQGWS